MSTTPTNTLDSAAIVSPIVSKPEVCGGRPCIAGTRIRVQDVYVWHELEGKSADEIVSDFPHLTMSGVYAALAYFWGHRDEIEQQMDADARLVATMKRQNPSRMAEKLRARHAANDQVSP